MSGWIIDWLGKHEPYVNTTEYAINEAAPYLQLVAFGFDSTMEEHENSSIISSSTGKASTSIRQRPTLVPTAPSTKQSRSPSPTRKLLALLERGRPPIRICQLGNAGELPEEVVKLRRALMKDKDLRIIPRALQVRSRCDGIEPRLIGTGSPAKNRSSWIRVHT
jgi:hypothetical protein